MKKGAPIQLKRTRGATVIVIALFSIAVITAIVWSRDKSQSFPAVTGDMIHIAILHAEKQQNNTVSVMAEITNQSCCTLADNRLFVVSMSTEGTRHTNKNGKNKDGGTAKADDPPGNTPVRELEGSFAQIPPNESVKIEFTVPIEKTLQEPLYVIFQSWKIRHQNTEDIKAISVTELLRIPF